MRPWFLDLKARNQAALTDAIRLLSKGTHNGCAGQFVDDRFVEWMEEAVKQAGAVREADDDDILRGGPR